MYILVDTTPHHLLAARTPCWGEHSLRSQEQALPNTP